MTFAVLPGLSHTGMVVHDLDEAMHVFGEAFGCKWAKPSHARANLQLPAGLVPHEWRSTYSTFGPHYLELTELIEGTFFLSPGLGVQGSHHTGRWVKDLEREVHRLQTLGFIPVMTTSPRLGRFEYAAFLIHPVTGISLELLDEGMKGLLEEWLAGGIPPAERAAEIMTEKAGGVTEGLAAGEQIELSNGR